MVVVGGGCARTLGLGLVAVGLCRDFRAVHGHWDGAGTLGLCRDFGAVCWYDLYSSINGEYRND